MKPLVEIVTEVGDAIDFDLRPADVLFLRTGPSRIDPCAGTACAALLAGTAMPPESATRSNASLAYLPKAAVNGPYVLVAQSGRDTCAGLCDTDVTDAPGLYVSTLGPTTAPPRRIFMTVAPTAAKSGRTTDGFLVGRGEAWAVAQVVSNEAPAEHYTTVFVTQPSTGVNVVPRTFLSRGFAMAGTVQPFAFAAVTTPRGLGGYAAADGDLRDIADGGAKAGLVPLLATVTTNDPGSADVFALGKATPAASVVSFRNSSPIAASTLPFPALDATATALAATDRHVVFLGPWNGDGGTAVSLHECLAADVLAKTCTPATVDLPVETIQRVRTRGSLVYVLGRAKGVPRLVRVTLP